ncbi:hypothetical protein VFPPC_07254 [Pochonia chlamydosporia 170]|uniref:Uncharacterized protein n=1 Tax=Pochonia chlamydosporia 170 TaxID=1380566 RepID=A0A179F9I3_METCM|nr:hypothetical protein VFPPC_07254 [Pochonia chlamydosporia 170]OAQ62057.1 hypothetical protein VFPPC_07254 [Pochonia chlamydosporia 170]
MMKVLRRVARMLMATTTRLHLRGSKNHHIGPAGYTRVNSTGPSDSFIYILRVSQIDGIGGTKDVKKGAFLVSSDTHSGSMITTSLLGSHKCR